MTAVGFWPHRHPEPVSGSTNKTIIRQNHYRIKKYINRQMAIAAISTNSSLYFSQK